MKDWILAYLLVINLIAWAICGVDKQRARRGSWRIPEKTLMLTAVFGGSVGLLVGMRMFHHKTKHLKFTVGVPVILILQGCIAAYFCFFAA